MRLLGTDDENLAALDWIRTRPAGVQQVMRRLPPSCVVRATRTLRVPAPGEKGVVVSYIEKDDGRVNVRVAGLGGLAGECEPDWLELVEATVITPEEVEAVLRESVS